jgi:hypothetical protein
MVYLSITRKLTLRHLFNFFDRVTTDPKTFIGFVGKLLNNCEHLPVINFGPIECTLVMKTKSKHNFSTDQLYLFEICQAIHSGSCDENLAKRNSEQFNIHDRLQLLIEF